LLVVGLLILQGCAAVGPDYEAPEIIMPDAWHESLVEGLESGDSNLHVWWKALNDPVLESLIQRAAEGNLDLKTAMARIEEARARRGVAEGEFYPDIDADVSYSREELSENVVPRGFRTEDQSLYSVGFDAAWEIDVFGRIRRSVESADAALQASVEDYRDVLVTLFAEVALNYTDVRSLQARLEVARENVQAQRETLELVETRFDAGLVPKLDVTQARSNLAISESTMPSLESSLIQAYNRLSVLLGEQPGALQAELAEMSPIPAPPGRILVGIPAELLRQRPDIRRAERDLAAQTAQIGVATADLYPRFSLSGFFAYQARDNEDVFDASSAAYSVGPSIRWNIFDGSRILNNIRVEEARTKQALITYEQTVLLALEEVEDILAAYTREKVRMASLQRAVEATQESVSLVQTLYVDGLTDFQNVLDTERALLNQQDTLMESQGQVTRNLVSLYKALGGGWDPGTPGAESDQDGPDQAEG
jgi:NodT family efflux transporter outer membrane factor (OMF) lipoprotein